MNQHKVKILYVESTLESGGPTTQLFGIVRNLDRIKFEPIILTLSTEQINSSIKIFIENGIRVDSLNLSRAKFAVYGKYMLKKKIQEYKPDIIHSSGLRADGAINNLKLDYLHCMTIHNYVFDDYVSKFGAFVGKIASYYGLSAIKNCKYPICCSKTLQKMYCNILNKKLYAVQNGVDIDKFKTTNNQDEKNRIRLELGITDDRIVFLVVSTLIKRKDPLTIIRAFKEAKVDKEAVLIILGDGDLLNECKKESYNNIIIKGKVNNVQDYLKASDIYISASKSEGLPYSVIEAGSSGLNLVLSSIPQHIEIFEQNPMLVKSFEVGNIAKLASIIKEIANKDISLNNKKTIEHIRKNFSDKLMSKNYEKIYYRMIRNK
ncbi:glycosyltransferase family 4 protein [Clostridium estertheticum]|uniref:Glycosyltransferase family 4 protein n=1 Tax=Clostridium estertheticum TaxID=238834 RepID=A0AA47EHM2_9CLOT|nr:glycosyltransferase family 4 protein [Clostridium estertheticum]MBU3155329.1 glycosyltransferase family 4 protein [Clostridium estertheticum]WAG60387.1 glycosyltransferase family 4 protein [Clostridium estertheticum]